VQVRQNVLDMTLHIAQYSNIIADLRDEIRRLRQKLDQQQPALPQKQGAVAMATGYHSYHAACVNDNTARPALQNL